MIVIIAVIILIAGAWIAARRYQVWRDRRDLLAPNSDLWAHTLPYEPSARERRQ